MAPDKGREGASEPPSVDSWNEKDQKITVSEGGGFLYRVGLRAKVTGPPSTIYGVLTDPAAQNVFRSIKACTFRKVVEENRAKTTRQLEVAHRAVAKFLFISITFETRLDVWEDDVARKIRFANAQEGFMKKFEGTWHIQPFTNQTLRTMDAQPGQPGRPHMPHIPHMPNPFSALQHKFGLSHECDDSLVILEQAILPASPAPPGVKHLIRRLCAKQARDMMEDLRAEVDRREVGKKEGRSGSSGGSDGSKDRAGGGGLGRGDKKGQQPSGQAAPAACMTLAQPANIWDSIEPLINVTIKL
ncbi:hypothetical protein FOA52_006782 [Chlamydomonas sp. UWO 241]|nr:hypothetical protein FOA52_006782 [Chlamydomonas sp. UWO 241]